MNFAELLRRAESFATSTLSVRSGAGALIVKSFSQLVADVRTLQASLRDIGLQPGHIVGVQAAGTYEFIVWDLALADLGAIAHVFPEDWPIVQIQGTAAEHRFAFFVSQQCGTLVLPSTADPGLLRESLHVLQSAERCADSELLSQVYSSGTSGTFKGLLITRPGAEDLASEFIETFGVDSNDRYLFFLPLSHFQQRLSIYMCLFSGASIMHTPYTHVFHDIARFQPTFLIAPPIFYETALATLMPRVLAATDSGGLQAGFGGKIRFMIVGMAPIRRNVLEAYQRHGMPLFEAYGITEVGSVTWNVPGDNRIGTVGKPLKRHRVVLAEDSEILVQARHPLARGYFAGDTDQPGPTFLENGFIATGDVGEFDGAYLLLKGRKKDIIITSAGVKFHPAELEDRLLVCEAVKQAVVITDCQIGDVVAVISVSDPHDQQICMPVQLLVEEVNASMPSYKRIARTVLTRTRFTVENGMLTRTLKPNRTMIARQFSAQEPFPTALAR